MKVATVWLPESLPAAQRETTPLRLADLNPLGAIIAFIGRPSLGKLLLALCLFNIAFQGANSIETLFLIERFAAQPWQVGVLLVIAGGTITLVQRLVAPLIARYGEQGTGEPHPGHRGDPAPGHPEAQADPYEPRASR